MDDHVRTPSSAWDAEIAPAKWAGGVGGGESPAAGDASGVYPGAETKDEPWQSSGQAATQQGAQEPEPPRALPPPSAKRHHSMAFEIARVERSGKRYSLPNLQRALHAWSLSRPRYVERPDQPRRRRIRLEPGQEHRDAVPYEAWTTSWAQMGDFGLDVGMYFVTMAQLIGATLVYAALCVVAMVHFASEQYSGRQVSHLGITALAARKCRTARFKPASVPCPMSLVAWDLAVPGLLHVLIERRPP